MSLASATSISVQSIYQDLLHAAQAVGEDDENASITDTLARMLSSWSMGQGAMPRWLGLGEERYQVMLQCYFPALAPDALPDVGEATDAQRFDEMDELHRLLMQHRTHATDGQALMADLIVAGCMGNDHLWQDLGLWCRADLSKLMADNFAPLAERNVRNMKWKKFLYKQLCETEGIYVCRSPSCEVCADFQVCFGPED